MAEFRSVKYVTVQHFHGISEHISEYIYITKQMQCDQNTKKKGGDVTPGHQLHFWNSYVYLLNSITRKIFCLKRQLLII